MLYAGSVKNLFRGSGMTFRSMSDAINSAIASAIGSHESRLYAPPRGSKSMRETSSFSFSFRAIARFIRKCSASLIGRHLFEVLLLSEQALHPAPQSLHESAALINHLIIGVPALLFVPPAGFDLLGRPLRRPDNLAIRDPVVRLAWLLPIADRRPEAGSPPRLFHRPLGRTERGLDL